MEVERTVRVVANDEEDAICNAVNGFYVIHQSESIQDSEKSDEEILSIECEECGGNLEEGQVCSCVEELEQEVP